MNDEDFVRFFSRHLVSLSGWYHATRPNKGGSGQPLFFSYSGFIISFHGLWCLATAGHILDDLEQHVREGTIRVVRYVLLDDFGPDTISHDPIPFDYGRAPKYFINNREAGLDFALIGLGPYYQGLLQANGIIAVSQENWEKQHEVDFGKHMMIGLPQKAIEASTWKSQGKVQFKASVRPMTIDIEKLDELPEGTRETPFPRFIGKINGDLPLDDIIGMSGGPILGFSKKADKYWIVAIQSSWLSASKIVFGCPIPIIADFVEKMVAEITPDVDSEQ
jgi:hypothetical protein